MFWDTGWLVQGNWVVRAQLGAFDVSDKFYSHHSQMQELENIYQESR